MTDENMIQNTKEAQKTVIAFVAGLLIGGLLVWVFATPSDSAPMDEDASQTTSGMQDSMSDDDAMDTSNDSMDRSTPSQSSASTGASARVRVSNQQAGTSVSLDAVTYPNAEGWVGVRTYSDGQMGSLLGVVRYSTEQGLLPETIVLQYPTTTGEQYAVVFYSEDGDHQFNLATDVQVESPLATFTAQ